jgi:NADPH-dependent ferric siderophore reductase
MPYPVTVAEVAPSGPDMVQVTLTGAALREFRWPGPASHLKVFVPEAGRHDVDLPEADADGMMVFRPGGPRPVTRTFTPLAWDEDKLRLDIAFLLHGEGPASQWAARALAGDALAVTQPRRTYEMLPDSGWLLLAGDESAIPAITTLLEAVDPKVAIQVLVEIDGTGHETALPERPYTELRWLNRAGKRPGGALAAAIGAWQPPPGPGQAWAACEARAVRDIRTGLLARFAADRVLTRGYWRDGHANHPDHDYGDDNLS